MDFENSKECARELDKQDFLAPYRERFHHPKVNGQQALYFTGNSLGLMPRTARAALEVELSDWSELGVEGHFHGQNPWVNYHELLSPMIAGILGAKENEVVCMNSLTVNLHLLLVSFYRPTPKRFKIISEAKMFPSDRYMLETQARFHGFDPNDAIIEIGPRPGEYEIRLEDIFAAIDENRDELALVFFGAINYFNGQLFDLPAISQAGHDAGAVVGVDLAHAAGNVLLELHDWNIDFAAWCSYKYLNSGPGNVGGVFVHDKHAKNFELPRFGGWWGHDKERRFLMENTFQPMAGAEGWMVSNEPILGLAVKKASLEIFAEVGMPALREKSVRLTGFFEFVLNNIFADSSSVRLRFITPRKTRARGCQLSLKLEGIDKKFFNALLAAGVIADWREPDVIRMAPVPLYNSFEDVFRAGQLIKHLLKKM